MYRKLLCLVILFHLFTKLSFICLFFDLQIYHSFPLTCSVSRLTLLVSCEGLGGDVPSQTESFWQVSTSGHVQSLGPVEGHHQCRRRRRWNAQSSPFVLIPFIFFASCYTDSQAYNHLSLSIFLCVCRYVWVFVNCAITLLSSPSATRVLLYSQIVLTFLK